jgi:hypothetical protein
MSGKADFNADEWSCVLASPMVAGTAITAADPSGLWGLLKEGMAGGWAMLKAKQNADANPLIKAVAQDFAEGDARTLATDHIKAIFKGAQASDLKTRAVQELRSVATLLDAKAPQDAAAFKTWLRDIAQKAAEAANEGGFLGFDGVAVSDAEKATLAEISTALNTVPATAMTESATRSL